MTLQYGPALVVYDKKGSKKASNLQYGTGYRGETQLLYGAGIVIFLGADVVDIKTSLFLVS